MNKYDVLVIGTGIAGLTTAIRCAESDLKVCLITREKSPEISNTFWAQGGIIHSREHDRECLAQDIQNASKNTSSPEAIKTLLLNSQKIIENYLLDKAQTNFKRNEEGELQYTKEAAHSEARILFNGDHTGRDVQISLLNFLNDKDRFPNVELLTEHTAVDLITPPHHGNHITNRYEESQVVGAYVLDSRKDEVKKILAKKTVLATGGVGALYLHHSNSKGARGDGHAMAARAGARLVNMEFIQFHPTTFFSRSSHRRFLITEAIRGEGGKLINSCGEEFMAKYHDDKELAPRDIVARAIHREMIETSHDCVYLDISFKDESWIQERFPSVYEYCLEHGLNIADEPIPVVPAAHYTCGGVLTDDKGKTNLANLYAVGEVACTGLHGANRLASTSLLEGLTWGFLAGENISDEISDAIFYDQSKIRDWRSATEEYDSDLVQQDLMALRQTLWNYVGLERSTNRLKRAHAMFNELSYEIQRFYKHSKMTDEIIGLRNSVEVALMVVNSSMLNRKSVGCFYLKD